MSSARAPSHGPGAAGSPVAGTPVAGALVTAYIGLGANLGEPILTLRNALAALAAVPGMEACSAAALYRTAPVDSHGPDYINTVARVRTRLSPWELLDALQAIEDSHGRLRPYRNAPRTLDLDVLLYGECAMADERLVVPHPRMHERAFVLAPLQELAPQLKLSQGPIAALLAKLNQPIQRLP